MLLRKTYGIDLGSSSIKVYSFFKNKSYMEKNMHNHPGGNPSPSVCDKEITERISQAGEMLGICLLDHIIIGDQRYVSFREQGLLDEYPV